MPVLIALILMVMVGCGGNSQPPVTISDLSVYLVQSRCPDGGLPTTCSNPVLQRAVDLMSWRRWDGLDQISDGAIMPNGSFVTTWAYGSGPFDAARGDGGEVMTSDGTTARIVATQDGSKPGIQRFTTWGLFNNKTIPCSRGWTAVDIFGRACSATVTYPAGVVADTIISEHFDNPNYQGKMERFYMAKGWGRLVWERADPIGTVIPRGGYPVVGPSGGPGLPNASLEITDRRVVTNIISVSPVSVTQFGWPGLGFTP